MVEREALSTGTRVAVSLAAFVIIVAGMRAASPILVPFLLSFFIALICAPPMFWMQGKGIPDLVAILFIVVAVVAVALLVGLFVGSSLNDFSSKLPMYYERLSNKVAALIAWLEGLGVELPEQRIMGPLASKRVLRIAASAAASLSGVFTNAFMILLTVVFILLEASSFPKKLQAGLEDPEKSLASLRRFSVNLNRYLAIKTLFSLLTGASVGAWLYYLDVHYPLLWALLAFFLNYVPNIGSIIAAVPPVLLALIQFSLGSSLLVALGYVVANVLFGSVLEPRYMGRGLGLSTLVVFLSLVFWGWVLGVVGMVLSVPLTMILKIALESSEDTRWIAVILGSGASEDGGTPERFSGGRRGLSEL